jgi:hypothetical protein
MLSKDDIQKQSERAYGQWCKQWREHAKHHSKWPMKSLTDFENSGIGKAVLCVGNGYSFEEEIETIKANWQNVDIICCDKSLGHLLDHGITPTFCLVADANVNYEKYLKPWENKLQGTILLGNVCANPMWADKGNWKDRYFFCVKDVLQSEHEFMALSGCPNVMAAGTNVSNALVIALTQCDNSGRRNFFGYDKILLIGFDYSWSPDKKYYAFDERASGKTNYMRHAYTLDQVSRPCYSSNNLIFSAKWLGQYISAFNLPVVQCTKRTIFGTKKRGILAEQMQYSFRPENRERVLRALELRQLAQKIKKENETLIKDIARDHYYSYLRSVS